MKRGAFVVLVIGALDLKGTQWFAKPWKRIGARDPIGYGSNKYCFAVLTHPCAAFVLGLPRGYYCFYLNAGRAVACPPPSIAYVQLLLTT